MKKLILLLLPLLFAACSSTQGTPDVTNSDNTVPAETSSASPETSTKALIDSIAMKITEEPLELAVIVKGNLRNSCEKIDKIKAKHLIKEALFTVNITTRNEGEVCTEALVPFEETVYLPTMGIKKGQYTVDVNGEKMTFEL